MDCMCFVGWRFACRPYSVFFAPRRGPDSVHSSFQQSDKGVSLASDYSVWVESNSFISSNDAAEKDAGNRPFSLCVCVSHVFSVFEE